MIRLVRAGLQWPYTFVVLALLILIIEPLTALSATADIFPNKDLSGQSVENAISAQNLIIPAGTAKINDAPDAVEELNDLPIKKVNGATLFMRDVGYVRDGSPPQQSLAHVNGWCAVHAI